MARKQARIKVEREGAVKETGKGTASQLAKLFYKPARTGRNESDHLHILVPRLFEGAKQVEPINVSLGQSIHPENEGIVITSVQVGRFDPASFQGSPRGKGVGQITLAVRRDPEVSTEEVVHALKNSLFEQGRIEIAEVRYVTRSADLPGNSTGPGPKPRPKIF